MKQLSLLFELGSLVLRFKPEQLRKQQSAKRDEIS
jgi:hypothetical protein